MKNIICALAICGCIALAALPVSAQKSNDQILILLSIYDIQLDYLDEEILEQGMAKAERMALKRTAVELDKAGLKGVAELDRLAEKYFITALNMLLDADNDNLKITSYLDIQKHDPAKSAREKLDGWIKAKKAEISQNKQ